MAEHLGGFACVLVKSSPLSPALLRLATPSHHHRTSHHHCHHYHCHHRHADKRTCVSPARKTPLPHHIFLACGWRAAGRCARRGRLHFTRSTSLALAPRIHGRKRARGGNGGPAQCRVRRLQCLVKNAGPSPPHRNVRTATHKQPEAFRRRCAGLRTAGPQANGGRRTRR